MSPLSATFAPRAGDDTPGRSHGVISAMPSGLLQRQLSAAVLPALCATLVEPVLSAPGLELQQGNCTDERRGIAAFTLPPALVEQVKHMQPQSSGALPPLYSNSNPGVVPRRQCSGSLERSRSDAIDALLPQDVDLPPAARRSSIFKQEVTRPGRPQASSPVDHPEPLAASSSSASAASGASSILSQQSSACSTHAQLAADLARFAEVSRAARQKSASSYDAMIDAMFDSGAFEGPEVLRPKFGGVAAALRRRPPRAPSKPGAPGVGAASSPPGGLQRRNSSPAPRGPASAPAADRSRSGSHPPGAAPQQQPAAQWVSPFAAAATAEAPEEPPPEHGVGTEAATPAANGWVSPFAAAANAAAAPATGAVQQWLSPFAAAAVAPVSAAEDPASEPGSEQAAGGSARAPKKAAAGNASNALFNCNVSKATRSLSEPAAPPAEAALQLKRPQARYRAAYAQNALSQCFRDVAVEQRFIAWHTGNSRMVDIMAAVVMILMLFGVSLVKPRPLLVHHPVGILLGMLLQVARVILAAWSPPWFRRHREAFAGAHWTLTMVHALRVTLWCFAHMATVERYNNIYSHFRMAGGEALLVMPFMMQVRFHRYVVLHVFIAGLCLASLPRLGTALEASVPQWDAARFIHFGIVMHCTLALFIPMATVRMLWRSERRLFVHFDSKLRLSGHKRSLNLETNHPLT